MRKPSFVLHNKPFPTIPELCNEVIVFKSPEITSGWDLVAQVTTHVIKGLGLPAHLHSQGEERGWILSSSLMANGLIISAVMHPKSTLTGGIQEGPSW